MNIAILGVGVVGAGVAKLLKSNRELIKARAGVEINPVVGLVRNLKKERETELELTDNVAEILARDDIDLFVELLGGVDEPYKIVREILAKKKPVVTANKALLAYHRYELESLSGGRNFGFEASVAGGIPIIKALREGLSANEIREILGIMNGTSNFILTQMMQGGAAFADALKQAQNLGYAEADPTFDIGGFDAAHKLLILASIAYGIDAKPEEILIEGIENISKNDIFFAKDFEYEIKLLAIAKKVGEMVELRVHPTLVPRDKIIAKVGGVMNAVSVIGDAVGETMFYGPGAGGAATASAVVADIIDIARGVKTPMLGYQSGTNLQPLKLLPREQIRTKYYFRLKVSDELGVLSKITNLMSQNELSIDSFLQKQPSKSDANGTATLFFTTHFSLEANAQKAVRLLNEQSFVKQPVFMLRIED